MRLQRVILPTAVLGARSREATFSRAGTAETSHHRGSVENKRELFASWSSSFWVTERLAEESTEVADGVAANAQSSIPRCSRRSIEDGSAA